MSAGGAAKKLSLAPNGQLNAVSCTSAQT